MLDTLYYIYIYILLVSISHDKCIIVILNLSDVPTVVGSGRARPLLQMDRPLPEADRPVLQVIARIIVL